MPYKSKAQQRYFHAKLPELSEEFDKATKNFKKLPEHVKKKKHSGRHDGHDHAYTESKIKRG